MVTAAEIVERAVEGETAPKLFAEHRARYEFAARFARGQRVLDLACGSGYGTPILRAGGASEVVGVDLNVAAIAYARERYGGNGVSFHRGDAYDPPPLGPFDLIVSFETIEHLEFPERFLSACGALLAPAGMMFVSTPYRYRMNPDGSPLNPFHQREWQADEFAAFLQPFFARVTMYGQGMKLKKKRWLPLNRKLGVVLARLQRVRAGNSSVVYPLPGPCLLGLWSAFPGYVIAACVGHRQLRIT
jgi:SAM-dependent methyltransferase